MSSQQCPQALNQQLGRGKLGLYHVIGANRRGRGKLGPLNGVNLYERCFRAHSASESIDSEEKEE